MVLISPLVRQFRTFRRGRAYDQLPQYAQPVRRMLNQHQDVGGGVAAKTLREPEISLLARIVHCRKYAAAPAGWKSNRLPAMAGDCRGDPRTSATGQFGSANVLLFELGVRWAPLADGGNVLAGLRHGDRRQPDKTRITPIHLGSTGDAS